jgi:hypothetical protein
MESTSVLPVYSSQDQANSFGLRLSWLRMQAAEEEYFA